MAYVAALVQHTSDKVMLRGTICVIAYSLSAHGRVSCVMNLPWKKAVRVHHVRENRLSEDSMYIHIGITSIC